MREGGGSKLSRICALVLGTKDITKPPPASSRPAAILFQISPARNVHFVRYVQFLRRKKRYKPSQFQSESQKLLRMLQRWKPPVTQSSVVFALPGAVIKEAQRLSDWAEGVITEQEVTQLRRKFGYPLAWHHPVRDYFLAGRMPCPSFKARINYHDAPHFSETTLDIGIDGSTTLEDILSRPFWKVIESYQSFLADPESTRQRVFTHTPLRVIRQADEIRLRIYADTTQAVVRKSWRALGIPGLQRGLCGTGLKAKKGLGPDMVNLLKGKNTIPDPERARQYRHRLKERGHV